ncbi:MAG: site-2 protease family protein [Chloroflexota bacterium]|jgi:Zn-dependent protease
MFGSIRLGKVLGIPVGMNWSVLLIAGLIAFSLASQILPAQVPGLDSSLYWLAGGLAAVLFFGSLLAHELSHALVARREGLTVSGITLWLLGGVARMNGDARSPGAEARIAGVGPLMSFLLALGFGLLAVALTFAPAGPITALAAAATGWLSFVNLVLAIFNLLPGAPLDGGRIARAVFWRWRRDRMQATRWSTGLGQVLGYGLVGIGILRAFGGDFGGIWFVLLGFFLSTAAGAERHATELVESLRGVRVDDIMTRDPLRVPGSLTVDTFVAAAMGESRASTWLVTGPGGVVLGLLGLDQLRDVRGADRLSTRIGELATPLEQSPVAFVDELVTDVIQRFEARPTRAIVRDRPALGDQVAIGDGVVGLLTPEDVARSIELGRLRGGQGDQASSAAGRGTSEGRVLP